MCTEASKFMKIRSVGDDYPMQADSQADGQTGVTKFIIAFLDFSKAPEVVKHVNEHLLQIYILR